MPVKYRTRIGIVGAGPAGLLLSHLLHLEGIESVVVENRSRQYAEERVRAGVLEQGTVDLLCASGLGERLRREGLVHDGVELRFDGWGHRIHMRELTGRSIAVYGQNELMKDLADARLAAGGIVEYEVQDVGIRGFDTNSPVIQYAKDGETREIACEFIAGCDGFHGICRPSIPADALRVYEKIYPFGWLGILAQAEPASHELIYASHQRGFALLSMRSRAVTRLYLQCAADENLAGWPDDRIWDELDKRFATRQAFHLNRGPILQKGVTAMRSFVVEPMQYGRLYLAGDAAHIVPPTGAKGLNLAVGDVAVLAQAMAHYAKTGSSGLLDKYSETCLRRVWRAQRFSWWMTSMFHRWNEHDEFDRRRQLAELREVTGSRAAATAFAENYAGMPLL